ncbi:drug/metabolite transporter (DMT)-like permease [Bacilli bacterium PM5-3]|nr:drug/metabolite transporter (DMT)-like permease [Bacilli bacterium PM5-3]
MKLWQARASLLIVALIWAFGYIATAETLKYISVTQMQVVRFAISVILLCIVFRKRLKLMNKRTVIYGICLGLVFFVSMTIHSVALETTTVSKNAFLVVLNVVFVPLIMYVVFKVKIKWYFVSGLITMIIGFFILVFNIDIFNLASSLASLQGQSTLVLGDYLTIFAAFVFAMQIVMIGYFVTKEDPINLVIIQLSCACIFSLIYCIINKEAIPFISLDSNLLASAFPAIAYLGISGCFAFAGQLIIQQYVPASNVALIFSTESMFASVFSVLLGLEPFTSGLLVGAIVITTGIIWAETGFKFNSEES